MRYAGFWIRFLAAIVDMVCLLPASLIYVLLKEDNYGYAFLFSLVAGWLYGALFESSSWQATPGKRLLGLRVTDLHGSRISFGRATGRHFGKYLSGFIFGIGYLMVIWTERKQALHDKIAGTLVFNKTQSNTSLDNFVISEDSKTEAAFTSSSHSPGPSRWILAGFDSNGHVVRIGFDFNDPRLSNSGLFIGRALENSDLYINDSSISRRHARFFKKNSEIWVEDLESTNGISINGVALPKGGSAPLIPKGSLTLGGIIFSIGRD